MRIFALVPLPLGGAYRERHIRWMRDAGCGMRWTRAVPKASGTDADGEGVWSRRPDAGAKLPTMLAHRGDDGGKQALAHRGEHAISRKTTAQGRPVVTACTCGSRARANSLCAGAPGACGHPVFPAPSVFRRAIDGKPRTPQAPREGGRVFSRWSGDEGRKLAGEPGFEPRQTESESVVLPLHHSPMRLPSKINALWKDIEFWQTAGRGRGKSPGGCVATLYPQAIRLASTRNTLLLPRHQLRSRTVLKAVALGHPRSPLAPPVCATGAQSRGALAKCPARASSSGPPTI